jgi:hypothetical protein
MLYALGIVDVEFDIRHARIGVDSCLQPFLAPARNDDMVVPLVERFGQGAANTGSASGNQDGIVSHLHGSLRLKQMGCNFG